MNKVQSGPGSLVWLVEKIEFFQSLLKDFSLKDFYLLRNLSVRQLKAFSMPVAVCFGLQALKFLISSSFLIKSTVQQTLLGDLHN